MSGLVIALPISVTDAILTDTDVPEIDYSAWNSAVAYVPGDRVISTSTHKVYESIYGGGAAGAVTITNGQGYFSAYFTWTAFGQPEGTPVIFSTTGTLPSPLVAGTQYYIHPSGNPDVFFVAATPGGPYITTTSAGSGSHTASAGGNFNLDPTDAANIDTYWLEVSATNRWKLFDATSGTRTAVATSFYYELTFGAQIDTVYVSGVADATSIRIRLTDGATVRYDQTATMTASINSPLFTAIPNYPNAVLRMDAAGGDNLAIGALMAGKGATYGTDIVSGARVGIQDYSRIETNEFGDSVFVVRSYASRLSCTLKLLSTEIDALKVALARVRARPCLYVAYSGYEATVIFGVYRSFEIVIPELNGVTECSLDLLGLSDDTSTFVAVEVSPPAPEPPPWVMGVNIHEGTGSGSGNTVVATLLQTRNFKRARGDIAYDVGPWTDLRDQISKINANGGSVELSVQTAAQWDHTIYTGGALATIYTAAYNQTYTVVNAMKDLVHDFELLNEVGFRSECNVAGQVEVGSGQNESAYTGKTAFISIAAHLRGMADAIHALATSSGLPLRVILGTVSRDWGFIKYMQTLGVVVDVVSWHIYLDNDDDTVITNTWFGTGGPLNQLAVFDLPINIGEFNSNEIYDGSYEDTAGQTITEAGFTGLAKHLNAMYGQTALAPGVLEYVNMYELYNEDAKGAPENHFGLAYSNGTPKVALYIATAFAGGTLSAPERAAITSRGLLTDAQITAMQQV